MSLHGSLSTNRFPAFLLFSSLLMTACAAAPQEITSNQSASASPAAASSPSSSTIAVGHGSAATTSSSVPMRAGDAASNVKWTPPARWQTGPEKPMRAATYLIPAASGDSEGAECAVFMNIGGGVDANLKRWVGQFEQPDGSSSDAKAQRKKETINGFPVTMVDLNGTFTGGGVAMGGPATKKAGYRLLGAIVETPQGEVFFKLTGPAKTVAAAQGEFQSLLKSLK
jgi:hypothetical protein